MDRREAQEILRDVAEELRALSYPELVAAYLHETAHRDVRGPSGAVYQVEVQAMWDRGMPAELRVIAAIDDGGWRALSPLTTDFIMAPDGSFVGE